MRFVAGFVVFAVVGGFHGALAQDIPPPPTKDLEVHPLFTVPWPRLSEPGFLW